MKEIKPDVAIFGGGVAGLWINATLREEGYNTILIEKSRLGDGQTIASQGIIHAGIKFALGKSNAPSSDLIAQVRDMPEVWRKHLQGQAVPDISSTKENSSNCYLWVSNRNFFTAPFNSRATSLLATKPTRIKNAHIPSFLEDRTHRVYSVAESVIDTGSLLHALAEPYGDSILYATENSIELTTEGQNVRNIRLEDRIRGNNLTIIPKAVVFAAGSGNKYFASQLGINEPITQDRPLRQITVRGNLPEFYGHCLDGCILTGKPSFTITSHSYQDGIRTWHIGGNIAENGPKMTSSELILAAQKELFSALGEKLFEGAAWDTFYIERAEPLASGMRPGGIGLETKYGNSIFAWPTKLALAPVLANEIKKYIKSYSEPSKKSSGLESIEPIVASPPWEKTLG